MMESQHEFGYVRRAVLNGKLFTLKNFDAKMKISRNYSSSANHPVGIVIRGEGRSDSNKDPRLSLISAIDVVKGNHRGND